MFNGDRHGYNEAIPGGAGRSGKHGIIMGFEST